MTVPPKSCTFAKPLAQVLLIAYDNNLSNYKQMKNFTTLLCAVLLGGMFSFVAAQTPCTEFAAGPYTDQGIDNAGCNGASVSAPYAAWLNEIYFTNVVAGGNYTFDICDGYDATTWGGEAVITVIEGGTPAAGAVTGGTVLATVTGCTATFDATATGTVYFILSTAADCGGAVDQTDNGIPTVTTNTGVTCVELSCADATAGTATGTANICFSEATDLTVTGAGIPSGTGVTGITGFVWVVSLEDISGSTSPNTESSFGGNFPILGTPPTVPLGFINDGTQLPAGTYYFTPVVFGNAVAGTDATFANLVLDPNCTHTGNSVAVTFYESGDPACVQDCPLIELATTPCVDGEFSVEINTTSMGQLTAFTVSDDQGNTANIGGVGTTVLGPYASGTIVTITTDTGGACDAQGQVTFNCPAACDIIADGSFEANDGSWAATSSNFGTPLCDGSCTQNGQTLAADGQFWVWFGGIADAEEVGSMTQTINIPANSATLNFQLAIPVAGGSGNDFVRVTVDGTQVFQATDADSTDYQDYTTVSIDLSAYANNQDHTIAFESTTTGVGTTNFFVDLVSLEACGSQCLAEAGTVATPTVAGNDIVVAASGFNNTADYSYIYYLTNGNAPTYTIVYTSTNGVFTNVADGNYVLHTLSVADADLATVQSATTIGEITQLINGSLICGELNLAVANNLNILTGLGTANANPHFQIANIVPMPVANSATLNFTYLGNAKVSATIYDITGRIIDTYTVAAQSGFNQIALNTTTYPAGTYFVAINDGKSVATAKMVK